MCDYLALVVRHEVGQKRQAASETQRWRTLISCITDASGKTVEEKDP